MNRYFKDGETVLFQGDSVTDWGRARRYKSAEVGKCTKKSLDALGGGYPPKVKLIYDALFPDNRVKFVNRGVSGDRVRNLLERYDKDIKEVEPDFISIMIGVNDTWRRFDDNDPTSEERFRTEYDTLLRQIKTDLPKTKIMIIEPFAYTFWKGREAWQEDIDSKRMVSKEMADKYGDYFLPGYSIMEEGMKMGFTAEELSKDGVHPAETGFSLIADEYMKLLGIL